MQIWVAGVDDKLTNQGLIWPGLGDTVRTAPMLNPIADMAMPYRGIVCSTQHRRFSALGDLQDAVCADVFHDLR